MVTIKWEEIKDSQGEGGLFSRLSAEGGHAFSRARVHGGWLVREWGNVGRGPTLTFVPDPKNEWN